MGLVEEGTQQAFCPSLSFLSLLLPRSAIRLPACRAAPYLVLQSQIKNAEAQERGQDLLSPLLWPGTGLGSVLADAVPCILPELMLAVCILQEKLNYIAGKSLVQEEAGVSIF